MTILFLNNLNTINKDCLCFFLRHNEFDLSLLFIIWTSPLLHQRISGSQDLTYAVSTSGLLLIPPPQVFSFHNPSINLLFGAFEHDRGIWPFPLTFPYSFSMAMLGTMTLTVTLTMTSPWCSPRLLWGRRWPPRRRRPRDRRHRLASSAARHSCYKIRLNSP